MTQRNMPNNPIHAVTDGERIDREPVNRSMPHRDLHEALTPRIEAPIARLSIAWRLEPPL